MRKLAALASLILGSFLLCPPASAASRLEWRPACPVTVAVGTRCGELIVPERRDGPGTGRDVHVPFAVISAPDLHKAADPFLFLMGGTGAGFIVVQRVAFLAALLNRDVIVVEQRGNSMASPYFGCESVPTQGRLHMVWGSVPKYGPGLVEKCRSELAAKADLNSYMTPAAADDLVDLRRLLKIEHWNVFGISYGARVATTLLRKDPQAFRSMILDSGQITGGNFSGWDRLRAIGEFFERCAAAPKCGRLYPDLKGAFERTVARLDSAPAPIAVSGRQDVLRAIDFIDLVEFELYDLGVETVSRVPAAIVAADHGDYALILALRGVYGRDPPPAFHASAGYPMWREAHIAQQVGMLCAEEYAYRPAEYGRDQAEGWSKLTTDLVLTAQKRELQVCKDWSFRTEDPAQAQPPKGAAPTLILNGDHDPVAPAAHGRIARDSLSNAQQVVFRWTGHATIEERPTCALSIIAAFLAAPDSKVDGSCADRIPEPNWLPRDPATGPVDLAIVQTSAENSVAAAAIPGRAAFVLAPAIGAAGKVAAGFRDPATKVPLTGSEVFRIASQTKVFTAAATLRLVEQGKLGIEQPIVDLISPDLAKRLREGGYDPTAITLRELLNHTSGLADYASDPAYLTATLASPTKRWTPEEQVGWAMTRLKPVGRPGERYLYSDTGYLLLADIIERQTGLPQAAAYRRLIGYDRFGLHHTWFESLESPPADLPPRAHQFVAGRDVTGFDPSFDLYGGGGLLSTLEDQAQWIEALMTGKVFAKPETLKLMMTVSDASLKSASDGYGLGLVKSQVNGVTCWGHGGFFGSSAYYCPDLRLAVAGSRYMHEEPPGYNGELALEAAMTLVELREQPAARPQPSR